MHVSKFSKAVISSRIEMIQKNVLSFLANYNHASIQTTPSRVASSSPPTTNSADYLFQESEKIERQLAELSSEMKTELKEELGELLYYDRKTIETTMAMAREKVLKRFSHFPMSAALIDMFLLVLESDLRFNVSFLSLRDKCAVEDRLKTNGLYGIDGEPNKAGRGECDHCPHVV